MLVKVKALLVLSRVVVNVVFLPFQCLVHVIIGVTAMSYHVNVPMENVNSWIVPRILPVTDVRALTHGIIQRLILIKLMFISQMLN